jgi:hypothetical protein
MVEKSIWPLSVKTKLPRLRVPELHHPEMMGRGLATARAMLAFNSRTMASSWRALTMHSLFSSSAPPNLSIVISVMAGGVGPAGGASRAWPSAGCAGGGLAVIAA